MANTLNGQPCKATDEFVKRIHEASWIFGNHLILGGSYTINHEDKEKILGLLSQINHIIDKYE